MANRIDTEVPIAGGSSVRLTLGIDLADRGIDVTLDAIGAAREPPCVRCNHVSARTMEKFRRLGIVRAVRDAGLSRDYPMTSSLVACSSGDRR
jgi:2-polyprenyl-6-methoxyphenol hydroxylase-like FAD-dependent oxidoreductase